MSVGEGGEPFSGGIRGFISDLIESGANATEGLEQFRSLGGEGMRTQSWYDLWGETAAAKANAGRFFDVDYGSHLNADMFTDWAAGRAGTLAYQVGVNVRDIESGASYTLQFTIPSERPITPQEAVDEALAMATQGTDPDTGSFNERVRGGFLLNAYRMTGRAR